MGHGGTKLFDIKFEHLVIFWECRYQKEHGITRKEEKESKLNKHKLLNEILHMQQSYYPRNDIDAIFVHHDFDYLLRHLPS